MIHLQHTKLHCEHSPYSVHKEVKTIVSIHMIEHVPVVKCSFENKKKNIYRPLK